jgi:hypothetical protein
MVVRRFGDSFIVEIGKEAERFEWPSVREDGLPAITDPSAAGAVERFAGIASLDFSLGQYGDRFRFTIEDTNQHYVVGLAGLGPRGPVGGIGEYFMGPAMAEPTLTDAEQNGVTVDLGTEPAGNHYGATSTHVYVEIRDVIVAPENDARDPTELDLTSTDDQAHVHRSRWRLHRRIREVG